jgi:replication factor C small subunit
MANKLLTEALRPKKMEHLILPKRIHEIIGDGIIKQNYLFSGPAGLGKTSAARILASRNPCIEINCSLENGIDTVREQIVNWCSTASILDGAEAIKVVILDEIDGVSDAFFKAMRGTIEKYEHTTRFIATCNYLNKIPEPMQSRFTVINFDFADSEEEKEVMELQVKRAAFVLNKLGIISSENVTRELVKRSFPDMRRLLNRIETLQVSKVKELTLESILKTQWIFTDIFELCVKKKDPYDNYVFLASQYANKVDDVLASLGNEFPLWLKENFPDKVGALPQIIYEIAYHQAQRIQVIDPVISMLSCIFRIQTLLNGK